MILSFAVIMISSGKPVVAQDPTRENTVWGLGYATEAIDFNPYTTNAAWGLPFMYEPLFGMNYLADELIPVIGTDFTWAANGLSITINLRTDAKWSDGEVIDADDVVFSYQLAAKQVKWKADMPERITSVEKVSATEVKITLDDDYPFSAVVALWLVEDVYIVPEHVWTEIVEQVNAPDDDLDGIFLNDWFNETFPEDWKVHSGPYEPYSRSATFDEELYVLRDDWWGKGKIHTDLPDTGGIPQVRYVGLRQFPSNVAQDTSFLTGETDMYAGFYNQIWVAIGENPYISTWFGKKAPYFASLSGTIDIAFNHLIYPLNEVWLRKALAYTLDYDTIAYVSACGYWARARQGIIDNRSATHLVVYNHTIQEMYGIDYDPAMAVDILDDYCYQDANGEWWTNDIPVEYRGMPGAADDDPIHSGWNIKLGGWEIVVPIGWSDVVKATEQWCAYFTAINVTCTKKEINFWPEFTLDTLEINNYELAMDCCGAPIKDIPLRVFGSRRGTHFWYSNVCNWYNPEFNTLYASYETLEPGSDEQKAAASRMQYLYATEIPQIPTHVNGIWYAYLTQYWEGWLSEENAYNQICTTYIMNEAAVKLRMVLNLYPAGAPPGPEIIPWNGLIFSSIIGVIIVVLVTRRRLKKSEKD